ncbi:hypothetical protein [Pseudomonas gingeri]
MGHSEQASLRLTTRQQPGRECFGLPGETGPVGLLPDPVGKFGHQRLGLSVSRIETLFGSFDEPIVRVIRLSVQSRGKVMVKLCIFLSGCFYFIQVHSFLGPLFLNPDYPESPDIPRYRYLVESNGVSDGMWERGTNGFSEKLLLEAMDQKP